MQVCYTTELWMYRFINNCNKRGRSVIGNKVDGGHVHTKHLMKDLLLHMVIVHFQPKKIPPFHLLIFCEITILFEKNHKQQFWFSLYNSRRARVLINFHPPLYCSTWQLLFLPFERLHMYYGLEYGMIKETACILIFWQIYYPWRL